MFRELYGYEWIELGGMNVTPFKIGNYCNGVDAVSYTLWFMNVELSRFYHD